MTDITSAVAIAQEMGFTYVAPLDCSTLNMMDEVRGMCADNSCGMYGRSWACPPGCGSLEECRAKAAKYTVGILVQSVGDIEDSYDFESMMEVEAEHKKSFLKAAEILRKEYPDLLALGSGTCTLCKKCTYPDEPCRFPEKRVSSMEAYGLLVNDVCKKNDMKYYYGPTKIAYTACYLLG